MGFMTQEEVNVSLFDRVKELEAAIADKTRALAEREAECESAKQRAMEIAERCEFYRLDRYKLADECDTLRAQLAEMQKQRDEVDGIAAERLRQLTTLRDLCPRKLARAYPFDVIRHRLERFSQEEAGRSKEAAKLRASVTFHSQRGDVALDERDNAHNQLEQAQKRIAECEAIVELAGKIGDCGCNMDPESCVAVARLTDAVRKMRTP